jgi:hypothetical protein
MSADDYCVWDFHFALSEECSFIQIQALPGIRLDTKDNNDGTKSVHAFVVRVKSFTEEALNNAKVEAKRLVDILAVLSGKYLGLPLPVMRCIVLMEGIR